MLDFSNTQLDQTIVHYVGTADADDLTLSADSLDTSNELLGNLLRDYFLNSFKSTGFYSFTHDTSLEQNDLFSVCSSFFDGSIDFVEMSQTIAQRLKQVSTHPNIKGGELYVVSLTDCVVDGEMADAIGIFKAETKDKFIKIQRNGNQLSVICEFGTNPKKLDKGCIIFNTEKEFGYKLSVIDNTNRDEAKYWIDDFLNAKMRNDNFYQTKTAINLCKNFVQDVIRPENNFEKLEQAEILTKTRDFFKTNETFTQDEFENNVIAEPEVVEAFREYKKSYEAEMGYSIPDEFKISADATKQSNKFLKSVIKLDKFFHIYIHGKQERVEKGFDQDMNLNYYKLYYEKES
ncbi:MAG: nucleoid-associated protein [Bacteroidales bacterium]|nr:nucleoid-associated protein [Bacteroidales bacterium]